MPWSFHHPGTANLCNRVRDIRAPAAVRGGFHLCFESVVAWGGWRLRARKPAEFPVSGGPKPAWQLKAPLPHPAPAAPRAAQSNSRTNRGEEISRCRCPACQDKEVVQPTSQSRTEIRFQRRYRAEACRRWWPGEIREKAGGAPELPNATSPPPPCRGKASTCSALQCNGVGCLLAAVRWPMAPGGRCLSRCGCDRRVGMLLTLSTW